jgi:thiol-disulfide isomerase/thioredoxin
MTNQQSHGVPRIGYWPVLLLIAISCFSLGQMPATGQEGKATKPDAFTLLNQVLDQYAQPTSYHLESIEESQTSGQYVRSWSKWQKVAISGPANRYHFEYSGSSGKGVQISDGKTEWIYYPPFGQYTQKPAPGAGPSKTMTGKAPGLSSLGSVPSVITSIYKMNKLIKTAVYAPDQTIEIGGNHVTCTVIRTEGEFPGNDPLVIANITFWIDKQTKMIRKLLLQSEGAILSSQPDEHLFHEEETIFLVAELDPASFPEGTFTFDPPVTASLVKEFDRPGNAAFIGKSIPAATLKAADGKKISLQSLQGKPLLLDFWATWCGPCVHSLPAIEKIYRDTREKGLVMISVDEEEDEDAHKAADFWATHKEPWPNFHGTAEIIGKFPDHGIPYFVLMDASGHVVFAEGGLNETKLRAAIDSLTTSSAR